MKRRVKLFVISDAHGHCTLLKNALEKAGFDRENENHILIGLGDYFDRGRENREMLKFLEGIGNKVLLTGNHEELLLALFRSGKMQPHNYINGTLSTIENFFGKYCIDPTDDTVDFSGKTRTLERVSSFIEGTINFFETESYVFVHGWIPDNCFSSSKLKCYDDAAWQKARWVRWTERYNGNPPLTDKTLVCGHMPVFWANRFDSSRKQGETDIFYGNGLMAIDAGTNESGVVNVLVLEDNFA